ncbi:hypothetical protein ABZS66_00080 [Dactylosporangium sp. NPDC005572]|uniref:hypothetical protein n=1 Tax=Dactylosporangium sp. NPDC005572 TaxID=3156889 RepID=UPI0033BF8C09
MPPELEAVALLSSGLAELTTTVGDLAESHFALREQVQAVVERLRPGPAGPDPADLRWRLLDRPTASQVWIWLIDWVDWAVDRFTLTEEIPACWPTHPPLVEELTALAAAWHLAYDPRAAADAPLRWLEALARARTRLREWDDATRCRNGEHHPRRVDLTWPANWRDQALDTAERDLTGRAIPGPTADAGAPS